MSLHRPEFPSRQLPPLQQLLIVSILAPVFGASTASAQSEPIRAGALPPASPVYMGVKRSAAPIELMLSTHLNTRDVGLVPAELLNNRLRLRRGSLIGMGLREDALPPVTPADDNNQMWVDLGAIEGLQVQLDTGAQTVQLNVPFDKISWARETIDAQAFSSNPAHSTPGLLVNYDLFGMQNSGVRTLNAMTELRAFKANMVVSNTMLSQLSSQAADAARLDNGSQYRQVRMDTTFSTSFPQSMVTLRVGDTLTSMQPWSRTTRIGGIQIARNFALQPYRVTTPIPALMGTSTLPSDIELFINGVRQYQGTVNAGPFTLNAPVGITGNGTAQIVLTDAFGRSTTLQYNLFGSPQLLAEGLSDWSVEAGMVRRSYGYRSFDYGSDLLTTGSYSYGLNNQITLQGHAEATSRLTNLGGGTNWLVGSLGIFSAATAISQSKSSNGNLLQLGHNWNNQLFYTSMQATRASDGYRDASSLESDVRQRASGRALAGYNHPQWGSFNAGMLYLRNFGQLAERYVTTGWSKSLGGRGSISFNVNHNLDDSKRSNAQLLFSWFLDSGFSTGISASHQNGATAYSAYANQSRPTEGGWGWSATAQNSQGSNSGMARVDYLGNKFEANAAVANNLGHTSASIGASGSLIAMDGHLFASRRIYDGFAVVSTNGVSDVPIKRENNLVGSTDKNGVLLVTQLGAYRNNKVSIDPLSLPAQYRIPAPDQNVVPTDRAGTLIKFDIERIRSASVLLVDAGGQSLALGSRAVAFPVSEGQKSKGIASSAKPTVVGYGGATYFETLAAHNRIEVTLPEGDQCTATLDWPEASPANEIPVMGPIICQ
ncbi:MAG: fimbria/pilus outer membrane usher protein [Burkholderiaceae bacterium]|jgi:outer membrane usher protein|nr:fimbria/pilus outer membrane usher protein [Burkholderiaceae bacterium]